MNELLSLLLLLHSPVKHRSVPQLPAIQGLLSGEPFLLRDAMSSLDPLAQNLLVKYYKLIEIN